MTDIEFELAKERVIRLASKWSSRMGMGWFTIIYIWCREKYQGDQPWETMMSTTTEWAYRKAQISIYLPSLPQSDSEVEAMLVHEFCHILLAPEQQQLDKETCSQYAEAATENVARAILWSSDITREVG